MSSWNRRLADGSTAVYHYHRESGARLPGEPGSPEFLAAYAKAEERTPRDAGKVAALKRAHVQFRDLRGTAVTLLSEAGATVPQIVAITGHTMQSAHRILERYLARTAALLAAAILHFENAPATAFGNRLQTGAGPVQTQPKEGE